MRFQSALGLVRMPCIKSHRHYDQIKCIIYYHAGANFEMFFIFSLPLDLNLSLYICITAYLSVWSTRVGFLF